MVFPSRKTGGVGIDLIRPDTLARDLDDDGSSGLFLFYRSHRAMLRARLSIAHLFDANPRTPDKWPRLAREYLRLAATDAARLDRILGSHRKMRPIG